MDRKTKEKYYQAFIIPCHRVINANGELGGYGGGLIRKQWLIDHESQRNR